MKKHLLSAAIGLLCLSSATAQSTETTVSWSGTLTPATQLVDGQRYLIYDASKLGHATNQAQDRSAMRYVASGNYTIKGNHSISGTTENGSVDYLQYTFMAIADGNNWKFLHLGSGKFIQAVKNEAKPMVVNDTPGSWSLEYNETYSGFRVKSTLGTQCWDGLDGVHNMCSWGGGATNNTEVHWYRFFSLEENSIAKPAGVHDITVRYPNGDTQFVGSVADGGNFEVSDVFSQNNIYHIPIATNVTSNTVITAIDNWKINLAFPNGKKINFATIPNGGDFTFPAELSNLLIPDNSNLTNITSDVDINVTFADGVKLAKIVSARNAGNWFLGSATAMNTTSGGHTYADGSYYLEVPGADNTFSLFNLAQMSYVKDLAWTKNDTEATSFTLEREITGIVDNASTNIGSELIRHTGRSSSPYINLSGGTGSNLAWYSNDSGSSWFMVYDEEAFEENISNYNYGDGSTDALKQGAYHVALSGAREIKAQADQLEGISNTPENAALATAIETLNSARFGVAGVNISQLIAELNAAKEAVSQLLMQNIVDEEQFDAIKAKGDEYAALGIADEAMTNAWASTAETLSANKTLGSIASLTEKFREMVESSKELSHEVHIKLIPYINQQQLVCVRLDNNIFVVNRQGENQNANKTTLTLKPADGGFKIYNEYSGKYFSFPSKDEGNNIPTTECRVQPVSEDEAGVFYFDINDVSAGRFGIHTTDTNAPENRRYLHTNGHVGIVRWAASPASSWFITRSDAATATSEANLGANDDIANVRTNFAYTVGTGVGEYTAPEDVDAQAYKNAVNAVNAITDNSTNAEKHAAAGALRALGLGKTFSINMPKAGHFYRLFGINTKANRVLTSNLLGGTSGNKNRLKLEDTNDHEGEDTNTDNRLETAFYFDGTRLVSVTDGMVLTTTGHTKTVAANPAPADETTVFEASNIRGAFYVKTDGRYLYNGWVTNETRLGHLDSGTSAGTDEAYRWRLSDVNWLPIPGSSANGWTTFQAPIELNTRQGVTAYSLTFEDNYVVLTEITSGVIPANTPVALHFQGAQTDDTTGLVYLNPRYSDAEPTGDSHLAKAKADGVNYITLSDEEFAALTDANVPGFKAVFEAPEAKTYAMVESKLHDVLTGAEGKVYTLRSNDSARGYVIHENGQERLHATATHNNADATDLNYQWTLVKDGENVYLYNLGAQKFAAAYAKHDSQGEWPKESYMEFDWHFSDYPTAVDIKFLGWDETMWLNDAILNIHGGRIGEGTTRPAGMMVIAVNANGKVPCIAGAGNDRDGAGFQFTPVSDATVDNLDALHAKIAEAKEAMEADYNKLAELKNVDEDAAGEVGYFDADTRGAYLTELNKVSDDDETEAKYYAYVRAQNKVSEPAYNEFAHSGKYNLMDENGQYYHAAATKNADGSYTLFAEPAAIDGNDPTFNWLAKVSDDGLVTLTHTFQAPASSVIKPRNAMHRAASDFKDFPVNFVENEKPEYDGYGNITLPFEGQKVTLRATTLADSAQTTAIREIEAAGEGNAETIYDLQGRRLNRAGRGINIINGKKVYIK